MSLSGLTAGMLEGDMFTMKLIQVQIFLRQENDCSKGILPQVLETTA